MRKKFGYAKILSLQHVIPNEGGGDEGGGGDHGGDGGGDKEEETGLKTFRMLAGVREQGGPKWFYPKCPRQLRNSECGYYVIHYMQSIVSSGHITVF
ncbi:hypothetical protein K1719_034134 [Acacia pycnantha]|nr:hypothetical protein K1719_034134 [Acacia pycnantha]